MGGHIAQRAVMQFKMDSSEFRSSRHSSISDANKSMNLELCITKLINNVAQSDADHQPPGDVGRRCRLGGEISKRGHPHQQHGGHLPGAEPNDRAGRGVYREKCAR